MLEYLRSLLPSVRRTEDGASAVEYGLLVAGIAALVVAIVFLLGGVIEESFSDTCTEITDGATAGGNTLTADCS
ncbi:Flp family type IVb pilin [Nocardioides aequoreus]|uniref:Flp family type IVb pilin n=1 Tax=Nocardioides aequoreus TaxID=397278 RepID=UPI00068AEC7D|nr:Flp family type IVb pilin [Nocardioides aequoreus]